MNASFAGAAFLAGGALGASAALWWAGGRRRRALVGLKASLGAQRRIQIGELFEHLLFQLRDYFTSITSISEALALEGKGGPLAPKLERLGSVVREANQKLARVLDSARAGTALDALRPESFDAAALVRELAAAALELRGAAPIRLEIAAPAEVPITMDRLRASQLVMALLENAVEALGARGGRLRAAVKANEQAWSLEVSDDGPGVPPGSLASAFEPWTTTKRKRGGIGLGLSMARRTARSYGGELELLAGEGGALARLTLPRKATLPTVVIGESTWAARRAKVR